MVPVIIPVYGKKEQLERCIACLRNQTVEVEIFVRDNSVDNIYFTAAVNEGIKKYMGRDGDYILILNQDMYLERNAVEEMLRFMESHRQCGIAVPLQMHGESPDYVVCAGGYEAFPFGRHQHGKRSEFTEDEQVIWGNGACMMFRKEMVREIGLLDENLVFIGSDSDYCFTARSRGWQVWRVIGARGVHEAGASGTVSGASSEALKIKDMLYFGRKWLTGELYKQLAFEGARFTPQAVDEIMTELTKASSEIVNRR